jgi:hypothetical protein
MPRVEGFEVLRLIGSGGFSRVYEAVQLGGIDRHVAIKILNTRFENEQEQRKFENECRVMGALSHPNIVTVYLTAFTDDDRPCIVMELFAGSLGDVERLELAEVIAVGASIADALDSAHAKNVFHRDIKPDNIFIGMDGHPALGDFGISTNVHGRSVSGAHGFTMEYTPPELFTGEDSPRGSRDIYSLGATLFRLASGEIPFPEMSSDRDRRDSIRRLLTVPTPRLILPVGPEPPASVARAAPAFADLIQQCMAKSPDDRPPTAGEVRDRLRTIQTSGGVAFAVADVRRLLRFTPERPPEVERPPAPHVSRPTGSAGTSAAGAEGMAGVAGVADVSRASRVVAPTELRAPQPRRRLPDADAAPVEDDGRRNRGARWVAAAVLGVIVLAAVLIVVLSRDSDDSASVDTTVAPTTSAVEFVVLRPPESVTVTPIDDRTFRLEWASPQDDVKFQILLVGSPESQIVEASPAVWTFAPDAAVPDTVCFEMRTVDQAETRLSQAKSDPACTTR